MSMEAVLTARLRSNIAVAALVALRIYPVEAPPGAALPHLVYQLAGGSGRFRAMGNDTRMEQRRVQIAAKADDFDTALALAEAVKEALRDWRDLSASPQIHDCAFETEFDGVDERRSPPAAGPVGHRRITDFQITFRS